ncbi:hypothetical protein DSO57_1037981 [Entomophthora muscae]|uniref:Uncharacterized protein n=1 Tax=Entomophthora muscae TaxID=34485 RepID=A0ACC2U862_9FUNG|nr:hypothetical protein DSO57_1037981 [Entomophthora muscae]
MASSGPSLVLLPNHVVAKVFLYLGVDDGKEARLACRALHCLTEPMFLQMHTLGDMERIGYRQFLLDKAKLIRGLGIRDIASLIEFEDDGLFLSQVFPNLRSISFGEEEDLDYDDTATFCRQCLGLKHLKHISLCTKDFDETHAMNGGYDGDSEDGNGFNEYLPLSALSPLMSRIESLYTSSSNLLIDINL